MRIPTDIRTAVEHLPEAAVLVLDGVPWEEYTQISEGLDDRPALRLTYDCGRLEIVTTSPEHENWKESILMLVFVLSQELGLELQTYGGATWSKMSELRGTEAETCFYVAHAKQVIGKVKIDIERGDPPPDVVVEIDKSNQSLSKFPIYASFGVPEIWRCDVRRKSVQIYELRAGSYVNSTSSKSFPQLNSDTLVKFIQESRSEGQTAAAAAFRQWIGSNPKSRNR